MPHITLKEIVKRDIEISFKSICRAVDLLSAREKKLLIKRLQSKPASFAPFKRDKASAIVYDFAKTNAYQDEFIKDLEAGLKR